MTSEITEEKVEKKDKFNSHHLIDWSLLVIALLVVLGGCGYYLNSVFNQTSLELSDTYRQDVVIPAKTATVGSDLAPTTDSDLRDIDKTMNVADVEEFGENNLNDNTLGL